MRIGEFGESYPPTLDGVGQVMYAYCRELKKLGNEAWYVAPKNPRIPAEVNCDKMLYPSIRLVRRDYTFGFPMAHPSFRKQLYDKHFDLIHVHAPVFAALAGMKIAKKQGIPLITTFHSKYYEDVIRETHSRLLAKIALKLILWFYSHCDEVWAVSKGASEILREYGYRGPMVVIPNGITPEEEIDQDDPSLLSGLDIPDDRPILLFVGQQDYKKNTDKIIDACAILHEKNQPFRLFMVGEGLHKSPLAARARKLGIGDDVCFTGGIHDRKRLMALYRRADLFVFPSLYDTFSLVVREAALEGTPSLVVENTCAAEEITDGVNGFTCQDSVESIADGILRALPRIREVGEQAKATLPHSWDKVALQVQERYQYLIDKKKAERS